MFKLVLLFIARNSNTVTIIDKSGNGLVNYPLQLGRPFLKGEIPSYPGVKLNGTAISTQSEVTNRHDDGSVKFAVISVIIPNIPPNGLAFLTFYSTIPTTNGDACSINNLLADLPNVDVKLNLQGNNAQSSVTLRNLINQSGMTKWTTNGPIRCELLVADHLTRKADFGLNGVKSFRPIFHVSYWPGIKAARVRAILENSNMDTLQDIQYDLTISTGLTNSNIVHTQSAISHWFGSRWTKVYWFNYTPEIKVNILYNVEYLSLTNYVPNYSQNDTYSEYDISNYYQYYLKKPISNINDPGIWTQYMPTTGMRDDIGVMPQSSAYWLCDGDWRMREISVNSANLAGAWSAHFREVDSTLYFDRNKTTSAIGLPLSLNAHPTLWFPDNNGIFKGALNVPRLSNPYEFDAAHQPDPFSIPYMLTGDYYFLESLQLWASLSCLSMTDGAYGRGLSGYGGIQSQLRGIAWITRTRMYATLLSPDQSIEKVYFNEMLEDAIAYWEGVRGVNSTKFSNRPNYVWAKNYLNWEWSPLRFFMRDTDNRNAAFWQESFMLIVLGMMRDLGYPVNSVLNEYHKVLTTQLGAPGHDPRYMAYYWALTMYDSSKKYEWFRTWKEFKEQNDLAQPQEGTSAIEEWKKGGFYAKVVASASSFLIGYPGGPELYNFTKTEVYNRFPMNFEYRSFKIYPKKEIAPVYRDVSTQPQPQVSYPKPVTSTAKPSNSNPKPLTSKDTTPKTSNRVVNMAVSNTFNGIIFILAAILMFTL